MVGPRGWGMGMGLGMGWGWCWGYQKYIKKWGMGDGGWGLGKYAQTISKIGSCPSDLLDFCMELWPKVQVQIAALCRVPSDSSGVAWLP